MIEIRFDNKKLFEDMHEALKGSRGYIDNEIMLTENKEDNSYSLIVGYGEVSDLNLNIMSYSYKKIDKKKASVSYDLPDDEYGSRGDTLIISESKAKELEKELKIFNKVIKIIQSLDTDAKKYNFVNKMFKNRVLSSTFETNESVIDMIALAELKIKSDTYKFYTNDGSSIYIKLDGPLDYNSCLTFKHDITTFYNSIK